MGESSQPNYQVEVTLFYREFVLTPSLRERIEKDWDRFWNELGLKNLNGPLSYYAFLNIWDMTHFALGFLFFSRYFQWGDVSFHCSFLFHLRPLDDGLELTMKFGQVQLRNHAGRRRPLPPSLLSPLFCSLFLTSRCFENSWPETKIRARACVLTPATTPEQEKWPGRRIIRWNYTIKSMLFMKLTFSTTSLDSLRFYSLAYVFL